MSFIDPIQIEELLDSKKESDLTDAMPIIAKALELKGLSFQETATLLQCNDPDAIQLMFAAAKKIKKEIYGSRLVFFAPLYITNTCVNNCLYCGFRRENTALQRKVLTLDEIASETSALISQGHKRMLLVAGEHPFHSNISFLERAIKTVYTTKNRNGEIRRLNVNVAPLSVSDFRRLKSTGIGTYQLFQETYHQKTYKKVHSSGPKSDYDWRLNVMDRAQEAGIDDVGIGALLGLYDYKFEILAMLYHSLHLEEKFGTGPHTISIPRIKPAINTPFTDNPTYAVSDENFKKLVSILRMAVPYTGIILSTRESAQLRNELFSLGISQISAGSRTDPGAYSKKSHDAAQFDVTDTRTQKEVISDVIKQGFIPSFCTACYRLGRTGEHFMEFAKSAEIHTFCQPNAILTFREYLLDYADSDLIIAGNKLIESELEKITDNTIKRKTIEKLKRIDSGERDLYF